MAKIKMKTGGTMAEYYEKFLLSEQADGLSGKTLQTYRQHLSTVSKYLVINAEFDALQKTDLDNS